MPTFRVTASRTTEHSFEYTVRAESEDMAYDEAADELAEMDSSEGDLIVTSETVEHLEQVEDEADD